MLQVVVGDVSGKSVPAALYGAVFSGQLRTLLAEPRAPKEALTFLNSSLIGRTREASYIAVAFLRLELQTGCLTFSNGGMPYPYCLGVEEDGRTAVRRLELPGIPLGLFEDGDYHEMRVALEPGELLIVASDGCTEAEISRESRLVTNDSWLYVERHQKQACSELVRNLYDEVCHFMTGNELRDDMTIVGIGRSRRSGRLDT